MRIAHEIIIDSTKSEIRMDGAPFPFFIASDPEIEPLGEGRPALVHIAIVANNVRHVTSDGREQSIIRAPLEAELLWARQVGRETVLLGLRDIIHQLDPEGE